mmetsp:Transcript_45769/g.112201  ORF Transcript_45769/g.112201 Transcript_45769/m.112201 type:complete len:396 (+) Transcript_45769:130-1317(+)
MVLHERVLVMVLGVLAVAGSAFLLRLYRVGECASSSALASAASELSHAAMAMQELARATDAARQHGLVTGAKAHVETTPPPPAHRATSLASVPAAATGPGPGASKCARLVAMQDDMNCTTMRGIVGKLAPGTQIITYDPRTEHISRLLHQEGSYAGNIVADLARLLVPLQRAAQARGELGSAAAAPLLVDAGANMGSVTIAAAALGYRTLSFEPGRQNYRRLVRSVYANDFADLVEPVNFGLGAELGTTLLLTNPDDSVLKSDGVPVTSRDDPTFARFVKPNHTRWSLEPLYVNTLDAWATPARGFVSAIKIDVEGYEPFVIHGARKLLAERPPYYIVLEHNAPLWNKNKDLPHWMSFASLDQLMKDFGYKSRVLEGDVSYTHASLEPFLGDARR